MPKAYPHILLFLFLFFGLFNSSFAEWAYSDSSQLKSVGKALFGGKLHPNIRYFYMNTDNSGDNYDAYANGLGWGISYETHPWKGISAGISGQWMYNLGSSSFSTTPQSTILNRYEMGLFDLTNPSSSAVLGRLEKLYLHYSYRKSSIKLGRQVINTPFINPQDGRLRPTAVSGIWLDWNQIPATKIEAGYLQAISPRSTTHWYGIGESIGIYPQGFNPDGSKSNYLGNVPSQGIGLLGITFKQIKPVQFQIWNMYVDQVMYTWMLQADAQWAANKRSQWVTGLQYMEQHSLTSHNINPSKQYMNPGAMSRTWGAKLGWENKQWKTSLNFNRITGEGRYLMPREWGKDPFYTFMPRERNEGFGGVNAYVARVAYLWPKLPLKTQISHGLFYLPAVNQVALNKYAMPSYAQTNIDLNYEPKGKWKGISLSLIWVLKNAIDSALIEDKYTINKVNMKQINFVINYTW